MTYEVLIIDSPGLLAPLSKRFRAHGCQTIQEVISVLPADACAVVIVPIGEAAFTSLIEAAASRPSVTFFGLVENAGRASEAAASSASNITLLPANMGVDWLEPLVRKTLREHEHRREHRELLEESVSGAVSTLFEVLSITDPYSASIGQRLRYAVEVFCKSARLEFSWELETAALLAEIGVLTIPARVITRSQSGQDLSAFEKDLIAHVPERGADLLQQVPALKSVSKIIRYQGKNFDGSGLPNNSVAGERIVLGARVLKVLNDLFKLKDHGKTQDEAVAEMKSGEHRYDPQFLRVARGCFDVNVPSHIAASAQPLTVRELRPGQLLVSNVVTDDGVLLIRDGQVISARLLHKLRNFAFTSGIKEPIHVIDLLQSREMTTTFQEMAQSETSFLVKSRFAA